MRGWPALAVTAAFVSASSLPAADNPVPGRVAVVRQLERTRTLHRPALGSIPLPTSVDSARLSIFDTALPSAGNVTYDLPPDGWGGFGTPPGSRGWFYSGPASLYLECRRVSVRDGEIKHFCRGGKAYPYGRSQGANLRPPFAGDMGLVLVVGDQTYCASFGGEIVHNEQGLFKGSDAPAPATCPIPACGRFLRQWGGPGSGDGEFGGLDPFTGPRGIAIDASGDVYVADQGNERIQKFTAAGGFITKWGSPGSGDGDFNIPIGLAVGPGGEVYVADYGNHRVQKFSSTGVFSTKWGSLGGGPGEFSHPSGIAVGPSGDVYVTDANARVQKFTATGSFILQWSTGSGTYDVAVDGSEQVFVSHAVFVDKYTASGDALTGWQPGNTYVSGVATDGAGDVYVVSDDIQKFSGAGTYIARWGVPGSGGEGQFLAQDVAMTGAEVYMSDHYNKRIQVYGCP